jgi:hypothetical protein
MSAVATFYLLDVSKREALVEAHRNEKREVTQGVWPFRRSRVVGDLYLWEFLDTTCDQKEDFPYSGFCITTYLFSILELEHDAYMETIDSSYSVLPHAGALKLADRLKNSPPVRSDIEEFRRGEDPAIGNDELQHDLDAFQGTHDLLVQWADAVTVQRFGVLHLSC